MSAATKTQAQGAVACTQAWAVKGFTLSVGTNEHGSVKFMIGEDSVTHANTDDVVTMVVTPDKGFAVDSVSGL